MATIQCTVQRSSWYEVYFEYSYTQDKTSAKTTLTHSLKLKQITDSYDFDTVGSVTVGYTVSGQTFSKAGRIDIDDKGNKGYTITLASGTSTITHNQSTGEGSFTVAVDTSINSAGYGPGTIKLASKTVSLPTIYRASKPTVSASTVKMGNTLTIYTNRKSSSFTHTLTVTMGGGTGTIQTGVGDSYKWTVWDLASRCNNATSGKATITCTTYNGSATIGTETCEVTITVPDASKPTAPNAVMGNSVTAQTNRKSTNFTHTIELWFAGNKINAKTGVGDSTSIDVPIGLAGLIKSDPYGTATIKCITYNGTAKVGEDQTTFIATVPDDNTTKPQFTESDFALEATGNLPSAFSGLFIQGKTGVKASFRATSYYSTISKYEMDVDGRVYTGNPATSKAITTDGNIRVKGTVTDAREYFEEVYKTITVIPYKTPTIDPHSGYKAIVCERSLQDGTYDDAGTYLHIKCKRSYSSVNGKNTCNLQYQYKVQDGGWSALAPLLSGTDTTDDYDGVLADVVTQADKSYTIRLVVTDAIDTAGYEFQIPTADVTMHLGYGGYGVAFGKYSEATADNKMVELDADWDLVMSGNAVADFVVEQGTSGIWSYRKWNSGRCELWAVSQHTPPEGNGTNQIVGTITYPFTVRSPIAVCQGAGYTWNLAQPIYIEIGTTSMKIYLYPSEDRPGVVYTVNSQIVGYWK
jgi:hypothetical protein